MLYETFADSRYCTNEFTRNDRDYPAALELAADIADKLIAAYVRAMTARQQSMDDAADEIKDLIAEQEWEAFAGLQSLANENPNVRKLMAAAKLSHILLAADPAA